MENTTQNNTRFKNNGQKEKNVEIKNVLEKKLEDLQFDEIEKKLDTLKFDENKENLLGDINEITLKELIWDIKRFNLSYIEKIISINEKIVSNNDSLRNKVKEIENYTHIEHDVSWVYNKINQDNPLVGKFYLEIEEKHKNKCIPSYTFYNSYCFINHNMLNEAYKTKLRILNLYFKLDILRVQTEKMINFLECINYNYFE